MCGEQVVTENIAKEILDIEETHKIHKLVGICPYMHNKIEHPNADIIFMPYNYLIS